MSTIITKNSATSGSTPSSLVQGELAINVTDGRLFYGSGSGNVVKEFTSISASYSATSSFITASGVYGPYGSNSVISASFALTASSALNAQDILIYVLNQSGQDIAKGVVVHITSSGNSSDTPRVITASYDNDNNSANTLGITNQTIANGSGGYVMTEGVLKGLNTSGFTSGQLIYLGATGSIIGYPPQPPSHSVRLGQVIREQSNNGSIYVRIDNGYELGELHDVYINTSSLAYGDLLMRDGNNIWTNTKQLSGSYGLTGSLQASSFTGSLFGTASWAISSITSSYPLAVSSSMIYTTVPPALSTGKNNTILLGPNAGTGVTSIYNSNFIGFSAGQSATNAYQSNFIGPYAGAEASRADNSNFIGLFAGYKAVSASFSNLIGWQAGQTNDPTLSIGPNNIIIGTNISLPPNTRDSINLGGIIFATGSYSNAGGFIYSGSQSGIGRVGINKVTPNYTLDVSGSGNFSNGLTITGSLNVNGSITGSLFGTASWANNSISSSFSLSSSFATQALSSSFATTASFAPNYVLTSETSSMLQPYVLSSNTSSFITNSQTSSMSVATASYVLNAVSSSFASTVPASGVIGLNLSQIATGSVTASVSPTQFSVTSGSSTELIVRGNGVSIGNIITDTHTITGSLNITTNDGLYVSGGGKIVANAVGGDEGGEILLGRAITNTTLTGSGVTIDVYQNRLRFFEQGGTTRGGYIDISSLSAGASTNLVNDGYIILRTTADQDVTNNNTVSAPELFFSASANGVYEIDFKIILSSNNTTADSRYGFRTGTGANILMGAGTVTNISAAVGGANQLIQVSSSFTATVPMGTAVADLNYPLTSVGSLTLFINANDTIGVTFGNNTSTVGATTRLWKESYIKYRRIK